MIIWLRERNLPGEFIWQFSMNLLRAWIISVLQLRSER